MPGGKDGKENSDTPGSVKFAAAATYNLGSDTPQSCVKPGDTLSAKHLPKTSTPYPKEKPDHQLSISRIALEQDAEHAQDGPAAKRRREGDMSDDSVRLTQSANINSTEHSIVEVLQARINELKCVNSKWTEPFSASERFERFSPVRLDELLKEFNKIEQDLKQRVHIIKKRLHQLSCSLQEF
ncbi:uncharacterized protein [Dysidea avara]|uniref:uncharacterized protein isoform X2 n=1 Tax=Dysidea avara TaxID=196820 RepID=UPI0033165079